MMKIYDARDNTTLCLVSDNIDSLCRFIVDREMEKLNESYSELVFVTDYARYYDGTPMADNNFSFFFHKDDETSVVTALIEYPGIFRNYDDFNENLSDYLLEYMNLDLCKYAEELDISFNEAMVIFSLLHELSHMKQCMYDVNRFGDFISARADQDSKNEIEDDGNSLTEEQRFLYYRGLKTERYADSNAIILKKKYKSVMKYFLEKIVEKI